MPARLTHREACYDLRQAAKRLKAGRISRREWCDEVAEIMARWTPSNPAPSLGRHAPIA